MRSPFASLTGLIKLAKEIAKQPELKEYFDMIDKSVSRMDRLLIDLVSIVNVSQGKLNVSVIDFEKIVNEIIDSLSNQPRFSEIIIKKNIKSETLFFQSDERLIYSILQNIIDNAIKYRNEYSANDSSITIDIFVTNKIAKINITDNGIGIPSELQSKIFDMFYRATTKSSGTGLGLYIAKVSVEKLGGEISFQSELNSGTSFFIKLPNIKE
ncbi:MAG: HAMP domain-containing sensor histidine kinase [Bacteroidetes bacterium]|nr:HAMP domain-containing sensor histidine kinase [Bacteroidota bacterium]